MNLRPYAEYRDSRLPWVGKIPAHWRVLRNGGLFAHRVETGYPDLPILEVSLRTGVTIRDFGNSKRKQVMSQREKYKCARQGDIAYNMMRMWQGAVGVAPVDGLVSPAYVVVQPYAGTDTRYFNYLFGTQAYKAEVNKYSRGIVADRNRLYWDGFKQIPSIVPPPDEQSKIAAFLRAQDRQIAKLIRSKRRLIELLNEQKQTIIHRAVKRGLNPDVPLKPSGIDWLGDVPEHWEIRRLKRVCKLSYGDALPSDGRASGEVPVFGSNGRISNHSVSNTLAPCIVIGRKGSFGKVNYSPIVTFTIDTAFFIDKRSTTANLRWLYYLLQWAKLDSVSKDSAVPGLDRGEAYKTFVPFCSLNEQNQIAEHLDAELEFANAAESRVGDEIKLILEYRDRLISDVVTGQIDVRGWQLELDDESDTEPLTTLSEADENGESLDDDEEIGDV